MNDEARTRLSAEIREIVPNAPGVYAFIDGRGRLMYVGKSVNLRRRMGSYFRFDPRTADSHLGQLAASVGGFAWWRTRSELLALLLEDAMIKEYLPPLNTRQREMQENRYLRITDDRFPTCVVVEDAVTTGPSTYGPFKDWRAARRMTHILHENLGIRACSDGEPVGKCLDYDLGRCSGACRGEIGTDEYARIVDDVRAFLGGDDSTAVERLRAARDRASAERRFEEAARLQRALGMCARYAAHRRFADRFTSGVVSLEDPQNALAYRFHSGALTDPPAVVVEQSSVPANANKTPGLFDPEDAGRTAETRLYAAPMDARALSDRARIVASWAARRSGHEDAPTD